MDKNQILSTVVVAIILLIIYYFGTTQKRKNDDHLKQLQDSLKKGDKIITFSGLRGVIDEVKENVVIVATEPDNIKLAIEKWAVAGIEEESTKE